jgi:hypothetical protein
MKDRAESIYLLGRLAQYLGETWKTSLEKSSSMIFLRHLQERGEWSCSRLFLPQSQFLNKLATQVLTGLFSRVKLPTFLTETKENSFI